MSEQTGDGNDAFNEIKLLLSRISSQTNKTDSNKNGIFIIGEYGTGKTWLLYRTIDEIIRHSGDYPFVPVLMRLKEFGQVRSKAGIVDRAKSYIDTVLKQHDQLKPYAVQYKQPVFFLDGFDEALSGLSATDDKVDILLAVRNRINKLYGRYKPIFIVTSRESDYHASTTNKKFVELFNDFYRIELKDCTVQDAKRKILELARTPGVCSEPLVQLVENEELMSLACRPVFFALLTTILVDNIEASINGVVDSYTLLDRAIETEIARTINEAEEKGGRTEEELETLSDSLRETVFDCAVYCSKHNVNDAPVVFSNRELREVVPLGLVSATNTRTKDATVERPWSFVEGQESECSISFLHNIVREFLVAKKAFLLLEDASDESRRTEFFDLLKSVKMSVASLRFFMTSLQKTHNKQCEARLRAWLCEPAIKQDAELSARLLELLLQPGCALSGEEDSKLDLSGIRANELRVWNCKLQHVDMRGAALLNMQMVNTELDDIDLRSADLTGLRFAPDGRICDFRCWESGNKWYLGVMYQNGQLLKYSFSDHITPQPSRVESMNPTADTSDKLNGLFCINGQQYLVSKKNVYRLDESSESLDGLYGMKSNCELERVLQAGRESGLVVKKRSLRRLYSFRENSVSLISLGKIQPERFCLTKNGQLVQANDNRLELRLFSGEIKTISEWTSKSECFAIRNSSNEGYTVFVKCTGHLIQIDLDAKHDIVSNSTYSIKENDVSIHALYAVSNNLLVGATEFELYILIIQENTVKVERLNTTVKAKNVCLQNEDGSNRIKDDSAYRLLAESIG